MRVKRERFAQLVESSGEPEKISSAGAINGDDQATNPSVAIALSAAPRLILFGTRWRPSIAETMRQLSGFSRRAVGKTPPPLSKGHGRRSIAEIMRRLSGFSSCLARRMSAGQERGNPCQLFRRPLRLRRQERDRKWRPTPTLDGVLAPPPIDGVPFVDSASRRPLSHPENGAPRRQRSLLLGSGLLIFATCGAYAIYGSPRSWSFAAAKSQAMAGLASAINVFKAPLMAITRPAERDEERSAI